MIGKFKSAHEGFEQRKIVIWTDSISEIPSGWYVCDGNNGTPDLTDKMLRGPGASSSSAGTTGGTNQKSIDVSQMPPHSHSASMDDEKIGDHNHEIGQPTDKWNGMDDDVRNSPSFEYSSTSYDTGTNGYHSHNYSVGSTGGGADVENRPSYKNVIYIMKE